ncbi:MAG: AraC family ligand binding domain-containing protein [Chryseobacterium sp.]|uniref:AraC family ligand binding domain-containing protein n=1 Tax=Chryseobacterium sp. TaxID=1871047 RepID=UPI0025C60A03|nr:AraC family ligand binding domain-containing protein [Chryseobacterium sp.]MCJ7935770.1 AraC family ligand binding domain-containing protein [Chryseobacterium sp.]
MKRYRQFEPVIISDFKGSQWEHPEHSHNHYEIIFIKEGSGNHIINGNAVSYESGSVFLLGPEEYHYFEIEQCTHFIYLKFTDAYLYRKTGMSPSTIHQLEYLIKSRETHQAGFNLPERERCTVRLIFNVIISLQHHILDNQELIWYQLLTLSSVLKRNMPELQAVGNRSRDLQAIFCYIHKNIYEPDLLRAQHMAKHFNLATEYLGTYFKRNAGITLRNYISQYRNILIQQRMNGGRMSLKEIAVEFGLTDSSHLSKVLQKDISPVRNQKE